MFTEIKQNRGKRNWIGFNKNERLPKYLPNLSTKLLGYF